MAINHAFCNYKRKNRLSTISLYLVREKGLEPSWGYPRLLLRQVRLPIPPLAQTGLHITLLDTEKQVFYCPPSRT